MRAEIEKWRALVEQGIRYREKYGWSKRWHSYRNYARGIFPGYDSSSDGILPYNLVYTMLRVLVPNVYFRNPFINITPRLRPNLEISAKVVESLDNWLISELDIKSTIKSAIHDCFFTNRGIIKLGYDSLFGFSKDFTLDLIGMGSVTYTQLDKKGRRLEYNINVKPGMPWAVRVLPDYIVVPFGVKTLDECPWIDHIIIRPLEDVKADPKYKYTRDLEGTHMELLYKDPQRADFYRELSKEVDLVELHEIRDLREGRIKVFVPGYDKWLRDEEDILQIEGLPFVSFTFNEDSEYFWGASDVQIIEPQQLEMNEARTQAMLHRRLALVKFLVQEGGMSTDEVDKMLKETVGPVAFVKGIPNQVVQMLQPHIPPDLVQWVEVIRSDVREIMGIGKMQAGEVVGGRKTATEAQIVQLAHQLRMDERRDIVADALVKVIRKINQIIFDRWDDKRVAEVVGYDAAKYWVEFTKRDIVGEYNYRVDVESMTPITKALKKREIVQIIQAIGKHPRANVDYLLRMLLREFEWVDALKLLPPAQETQLQPMPFGQFAQLQTRLLQNPEVLQERAKRNAEVIGGAL
ncbi:MAG: hypothetical protein DRN14_03295 [Thermoplasmata archaeon]|nr:MAG: hypothetical protein DRN14_03295 [Thermoplasmata archaeon]